MPPPQEDFTGALIRAIQPIRHAFLAQVVYAIFSNGIYDAITKDILTITELASRLAMRPDRLAAVLSYASNEGLVELKANYVRATKSLVLMAQFRSWYELLIGGYGATLLDLPYLLPIESTRYGARNLSAVGLGSSGISEHDTIPVVQFLLGRLPRITTIVDLGSADAAYLVAICRTNVDISAVAVEAHRATADRARRLISSSGLEHRIRVVNSTAQQFVKTWPEAVDCFLLAFVLQEILAQQGREYVVEFLRSLASRGSTHVVIIEVDYAPLRSELQSGLGLAYYNPYFLLHELTEQRLLSAHEWLDIFAESGYAVIDRESPSRSVDPTMFEVGFLLRSHRDRVVTGKH